MAQLWGGRFTKETDQLVYNFNASISFDKRFYEQDIRGSIAHVTMLAKQGILTEEEKKQIIDGLNGIREDVENGKLEITDKYEDIHSFVEANLIDRIGDAGKKLHTGRSRNDQVALDMRLYTRDEVLELDSLLGTIACYVTGCPKTVLKGKDSQHQSCSRIAEFQDTGDNTERCHNSASRYTRSTNGKNSKQDTEKNHGPRRRNCTIKNFGDCHTEEYFCEDRTTEMNIGKQRNTKIYQILSERFCPVCALEGDRQCGSR